MCDLFRRSEVKLKVWYALIALYVAEWPQYAHRDRGGDLYIQNMRQRAQNFKVPACATLPVQMRFGEELNCGTNVVFLEGVSRSTNDVKVLATGATSATFLPSLTGAQTQYSSQLFISVQLLAAGSSCTGYSQP